MRDTLKILPGVMILILLAITACVRAQPQLAAAPKEFVQLLKVDPRGGRVLRPAEFDLTRPGAKWQDSQGSRMIYEPIYQDYGCYKAQLDVPPPGKAGSRSKAINRGLASIHGLPVGQNRNYIISVLVKTDFDRNNTEISARFRRYDKEGRYLSPARYLGLPAKTHGPDGWQRLEWPVTAPIDPRTHKMRASLHLMIRHGDKPAEFRIADFAFVELPPVPLKTLSKGEGVTFPGGPGNLPMKVVSASKLDGHVIVETTGAKYDFDTTHDMITASQRIDFPRELARWHSSLSLVNLRIERKTDEVCVLANNQITIGIQCDSMMAISTQHELCMKLTNLLGGDWNRYARDSLLSEDDFGGFTVNPYIPAGTGLKAQSKLLTPGLSFAEMTPLHTAAETGQTIDVPWNAEDAGSAKPGWQAQWTTRPGELFCTSVFPPRPFPWKDSFTKGWKSINYGQPLPSRKSLAPFVSHLNLWDYIPKTYGHSYSVNYQPHDADHLRKVIQTAKSMGLGITAYMSAHFAPTRDPQAYIDGVRQFNEKYHIDGVYSDGLPADDWMVGYKEMRMLRALFPSGLLILHDSMRQDGWVISEFKPFVHTYATCVSLTEGLESRSGVNWRYPRYVSAQFRKANSLGTSLGNRWFDSDGKLMGERRSLVTLVYNGRNNNTSNYRTYNEYLMRLYELWKKKGNQPHFYDRYFLPMAQELTGYRIGRTAMPIVEQNQDGKKVTLTLESLTPDAVIHYTADGTTPTQDSPEYTDPITLTLGDIVVKARAFAEGLDPSAVADIALRGN